MQRAIMKRVRFIGMGIGRTGKREHRNTSRIAISALDMFPPLVHHVCNNEHIFLKGSLKCEFQRSYKNVELLFSDKLPTPFKSIEVKLCLFISKTD